MSLYTIGVVCLLAFFAYPLAPDNSPGASLEITELKARPPGFSCLFLLQPRQQPAVKSFLARLFTGTPQRYNLIPINSFFFARDTIVVRHYIDKGAAETLAFPIKTLLPSSQSKLDLGRQQLYIFDHNIDRRTFILGTDRYGRDILSRLLIGTHVSVVAGVVAVAMSLIIGILLGVLSGYYRGRIEALVRYLISILLAVPNLLLVFAITLIIGSGFWQIFIAIGFTMSVSAARLIREQIAVLRELEYVQVAKTLGVSDIRIIIRHILPNLAGSLMAIAASNFAAAILIEAGLSFLGIGIQPPTPSWGLMVREQLDFLITNRPILVFIPGLAIVLLACAFNILGNVLKDAYGVPHPLKAANKNHEAF